MPRGTAGALIPRPAHVPVTCDEHGGCPHPDHVRTHFEAIHAAMTGAGLDPPAGALLENRAEDRPSREVTTRVECAGYYLFAGIGLDPG